MSDADQDSTEPSRIGCIVALVLVIVPGVLASAIGQHEGADWPIALFHGVMIAMPFAYVALEGPKSWLPWVVATALSIFFWGALIASAIIGARDGTGVNIGMGVIVVLASPFVTTAGAWMAVQFTKRSQK